MTKNTSMLYYCDLRYYHRITKMFTSGIIPQKLTPLMLPSSISLYTFRHIKHMF